MTPSDVRDLAFVALVAGAPLALVLIVALVRGYTISIHATRDGKKRIDEG